MSRVVHIQCKQPDYKSAVIGISLNGKGVYSAEDVLLLLKKVNKFARAFIILHGNDDQCAAWLEENRDSIRSLATEKTSIITWSFLAAKDSCKEKRELFFKLYTEKKYDDFNASIDDMTRLYVEKHPGTSLDDCKIFILEEMAYLTAFAIENHVDYFVYKGEELPAFSVVKKYFFTGENQNLFKWAELFFGERRGRSRHLTMVESGRGGGGSDMTQQEKINELVIHLNMASALIALRMSQSGGSAELYKLCSRAWDLCRQLTSLVAKSHPEVAGLLSALNRAEGEGTMSEEIADDHMDTNGFTAT